MKKIFIGLLAVAALVLVGAPSATATPGGSDSPTPYSVTTEGITLPQGSTFQNNGHVNIKYEVAGVVSGTGIHFEAQNWPADHPKKFYIGKDFIPWSAFGLDGAFCITWVQIHGFNEHFGEGKQDPVCVDPPVACVDQPVPDPVQCAIPPQPESWVTDEERINAPVCIIPASGLATVTTETRSGVREYVWNATNWSWSLPLEYTWTEWTVVDTQTVANEDCEPLPPTGFEISPAVMIAGGSLLLGGMLVLALSLRKKQTAEQI